MAGIVMRKRVGLWCVVLLVFFSGLAAADVAAIQADKLPQDSAILAAMRDAADLENYSRYYAQPWKFSISRKEVAKRLSKDLQVLDSAAKQHPENAELLLLTALVAQYAYNVDVENSHEIAMQSLEQAAKRAPGDFRPAWFHASLRCQTNEAKTGGEEFLSIEEGRAWEDLPVAFWDDYIQCATITNMPGHVLRAADHLAKMQAPVWKRRDAVVAAARDRFVPFDAKKDCAPREVWEGLNFDADTVFTSTMCGVRFKVPSAWSVDQVGFSNDSCVADFLTQFYQGTVSKRRPSVLLLVKQPENHETLEQFSMRFRHKGTFTPFTPARCPAESCIALQAVQPGMYGGDGDGHGRVVFFERDQPEFPDLPFESPTSLPTSGSSEPQVFHPGQIAGRIPGKLYYLVLLDTAASIEGPAMKDYELFLQNLTVE
jgi:hypothetical protein